MADELLETVQRLHSRLRENPEPRKLLKTFRRLGELSMTVDLLVETGVGKTVNSFRKHEAVGDIAKNLVAKWKKLIPQSADRSNSHTKEASRPYAHSRGNGHRHAREPSPEVERSYVADKEEEEDEEIEEEEERDYHTSYSPLAPRHDQYSPPQRGGYHSAEYESPEPEAEPEPSTPTPSPPPPRKETRHAKPNRDAGRNHGDRSKDEERRQRHAQTCADQGGDDGKKRRREQSPADKSAKRSKKSAAQDGRRDERKKGGDNGLKRARDDSRSEEEEEAFETPTMSFESFLTYDAPTPVKKKKKPSHPPPSSSHSFSSQSSSHRNRMSPPAAAASSSSSSSSSSKASKASKANGAQSSKRSHPDSDSSAAVTSPEKRRRVVEALPTLPEIPLPAIQPNYRPLPSIDVTPLSPQRRKVPAHNEEDNSGFTGKRFNSKMVVYSGAKTSNLPRMMTLREQCIRVLQNNIDSIAEVGGVPFDIMEPVLERCTPEQLYRIEQNNQSFTEDSDELWMRHCKRDFKRESPQEYESWREMYLRLHDEREERLKMLTSHISSAHANKPKGRQVKIAFVNSDVKPPRDVRRRQEKFGTTSGSSASSVAAAAPIKIRPASDYSGESSRLSSSHESSSSSSRSSAPGGGGGGAGGGGAQAAREKPHVKKIAPMMAKTIKAFKNRFSRR